MRVYKVDLLRVLGVFFSIVVGGCGEKTATGVTEDIKEFFFLELNHLDGPSGYWINGYEQIATFSISEAEFLILFPHGEFEEISKVVVTGLGVPYPPVKAYGNSSIYPFEAGLRNMAINGLIWRKSLGDNGEGYRLIYDRDEKMGFYNYNTW